MARFSNVLLVEDDPITTMVCERIIKMTDFAETVVTCVNGKIAIDHVTKLIEEEGNFPEIIFLDINMPVLNGWDFLEEFDVVKDKITPMPRIFILSSTVDPEDYKRAKSFSPVDNFISKPLSRELLENIQPQSI